MTNGQRTNDNDKKGDVADDWTDRWTEENDADDGPTREWYADFLQPVAPDQTRFDAFRRHATYKSMPGPFSEVAIHARRLQRGCYGFSGSIAVQHYNTKWKPINFMLQPEPRVSFKTFSQKGC